jgi:hypothetical protein
MFVFSVIIFACEPTQTVKGPPFEYPSIEVNTLKVFYAFSSSEYHPFPDYTGTTNISGIENVQNAFEQVWSLEKQSFTNKLAPDPPIDIINADNFNEILTYYTKFKERNQINNNDLDVIHVFGMSLVTTSQTDHPGGATVPYYAHENQTDGKMPALAFINSGYINSLSTNNEDKVKIKTIVSTHEIAHARGVSDLTRNESSCTCSHNQVLKQCDHCCHKNVDNQNDNYCALNSPFLIFTLPHSFPPYFCMKHKMVLWRNFRFKIAKGFNFPENFCNLPL